MAVNPVASLRNLSASFISELREVVESFLRKQTGFFRKVSDVTGPRFLLSLYHVALTVKWPVAANLKGLAK